MPPKQLDVLIIEDTEDDALLMVRELRRGGYDVQFDRVETASTLITAYESQKWDVILSDFALPGFNAIEALKLIRERDADIPFILLSGTVGEDIAVQAMRAGAQDFFAKDKLTRLVPAIERELSDAEHRRKRRWAEQELRQSEERFTRAFQSSPVAISISTVAEGILLDVNMQYLKLFGYGREEVIGHSIHDLNIWDAYSRRREIIQLLSSHSTAQNQDLRLRTKTGDVLECLVSFEQIDLGNELCILAMITDITDRKRAEEEIAFQAKLLNAVGQSVIATDLHGKIIYWNRAAKQLYGWTFEEVKGRNIVDVTPTEASLDESREIMSNLARGEIWQGEMLLRRSDDTTFPSLITNAPIHDKNGELIGIIGVSSDITKMKESEQAVRESERFARSTLDALSAHIAILDNTGTVIAVNQSWIDFATDNTSNAPKSAFLGVNYLETCDRAKGKGSEEAHAVAAGIRAVIGGQSSSFVLEYPCHSPSEQRWFLVRVTRFRGAGPVQIVVAHENITERKLAEEATKQYAKRLQLLHEIDQAILRADQPQSIALATLTAMHNVLDFHSANVTTFDLERQLFTVLATTASIPAKLLAGTSHPLEDISVIERLQQNEVYGVRDLFSASQVSSSDQALIDVGIRSYTRIPLISNQKLIGSINFRSENAEVLSEDQLKIAREVASQLAIAIENARLLEIEQQRTSELTALHQASLQLTRTLDMQTVLDTVLDYAILLVNANDAHIFLYDGNALTFGAAQWDVTKQNTPFAEPRPEGLTYTVARTGQRLVIPSVNEHPTYKNWQWNGAIIGLPLMATNEVKGVMSLAF
ncbi:MAG: PAS domain S-box protein, partial [Aggregatilineales bacterium]